MTDQERDVQRKLKVLRHAEQTGNIAKTCRYFGIGRASFYRWKNRVSATWRSWHSGADRTGARGFFVEEQDASLYRLRQVQANITIEG